MAVFNVFERADGRPETAVLVREGFSGWAFVLTVLWALWHRMWVAAAVVFGLFAAVSLATSYLGLSETVGSVIRFGIALAFGFEANAWRGRALLQSGYRETTVIAAASREEAELAFALSRPAGGPERTAVVPRSFPPAADPLGLFGNV